jgi:hypothetical protein
MSNDMSNNSEEPKSLVEQILADMFSKIHACSEFDERLIRELKQLAGDGGIKKVQRVSQVLKLEAEKKS